MSSRDQFLGEITEINVKMVSGFPNTSVKYENIIFHYDEFWRTNLIGLYQQQKNSLSLVNQIN